VMAMGRGVEAGGPWQQLQDRRQRRVHINKNRRLAR
jgi:hypothetical protein